MDAFALNLNLISINALCHLNFIRKPFANTQVNNMFSFSKKYL